MIGLLGLRRPCHAGQPMVVDLADLASGKVPESIKRVA